MSSKKEAPPPPLPASILKKYKFRREIGQGSYGTVWAAVELETNNDVAIKRVGPRNFTEAILAKRALREILLVKHLHGNENVTSFIDVDVNDPLNFNELYLVEGLMEADLNQILRSNQNLTEQHYQYFTYQLLRGLKWIHSAGVLHRDLKPGNLLVNSDCELRICDYGLARGAIDGQSELLNTEYVTTRYYRAPEVILSPTQYTKALDIWSVGCIFGEILGRKVVFKGKDHIDQLQKIFSILGSPEDTLLESICSKRVLKYIQQWRRKPKTPLQKLFPHAEPSAMHLMDQLLEYNPDKRITAEKALEHPYLSQYHQPGDEPSHPTLFDFSFEKAQTIDEIKKILLENVIQHKREKTRIKNMSAANHPCLTGSEKMMPKYDPQEGIDGPGGIEEELRMRELKI